MLRLRTTTSLSLLALAIGVAGTGWLSELTDNGLAPPLRRVAVQHMPSPVRRALPSPRRRPHGASRLVQAQADRSIHVSSPIAGPIASDAAAASLDPSPGLQPLAMPSDTSQSWDSMRGHLDGRVLLHVSIDGSGRVSAASMVESSGDPILDAHALRSVRGWRFAVPADHPGGISGNLPMHFSSGSDRLASVP